ncbi:MAG: 50S ribosomal protein L23 [Woeseiaceae bacterium]|nr:50S ribosomal protein L23 [Woeseiaceae bacterium]
MSAAAHQERILTVLQGPHLSEKSHYSAEQNQVVFKVRTDATKSEIKQAVEVLFEVSVESVQVMNYRGKVKRHGSTHGRRASWKKAYVRLSDGSSIDFLGAE